MDSVLGAHVSLQTLLSKSVLQVSDANSAAQAFMTLADDPELTVALLFNQLKALPREQQGIAPAQSLELLLLAMCLRLRGFSKRYGVKLLVQSTLTRHQRLQGQKQHSPSQLIRCTNLIADSLFEGKPLFRIFARLARYPSLTQGTEIAAELLLKQQETHENPAGQRVRPLPGKLLAAIGAWPQQDELLPKVVTALESQPLLSHHLCEHATAITGQRHALTVKQALLLLGPLRSRELILISHFETQLTAPYFPLRKQLLLRRQLVARILERLCDETGVVLPAHPELLTYLWVYDCWFQPEWTTSLRWQSPASKTLPDTVKSWQRTKQPLSATRALKLTDYWGLPSALSSLVKLFDNSSNRAFTCCRLAIAGGYIAYQSSSELPVAWREQLDARLEVIGLPLARYLQILESEMQELHCYSPYEQIPL
ncbi:MAG: hypothetical protein JJU10_11415 [Idiomarina sp.]|nr:hypothetical protein [Idiomarina sp.]